MVVEAQAAVQLHRSGLSSDGPPATGTPSRSPGSTPSGGNSHEPLLEVNVSAAAAAGGVDGDAEGDKARELGAKRQAAERQDAGRTERTEAGDEETEGEGTAKGDSGSAGGGDGGGGGSDGGGGGGAPEEDADAKRKEEEATALSSHLQVIAMHMVREGGRRFAALGVCR